MNQPAIQQLEPQPEKIYCANCLHCKAFNRLVAGKKQRRVKCKKGHWGTDGEGNTKTYKHNMVLNRKMLHCGDYESMGEHDKESFFKNLRKTITSERGA